VQKQAGARLLCSWLPLLVNNGSSRASMSLGPRALLVAAAIVEEGWVSAELPASMTRPFVRFAQLHPI
jgi:hypothetical protein